MKRMLRPLAAALCAAMLPFAAAGEAKANDAFDAFERAASYEFRYRVDLDQVAAQPGETVRLWIPLPAETRDQRVLERRVDAPFPVSEQRDALGNRMLHLSWQGAAPEGSAVELTARVEREVSHGIPRDTVLPGSTDDPQRFLAPAKRVPLEGLIAQLGEQESRGLASDGDKIRSFYDYVVKNMRYSKHGEGWGKGDAVWACSSKYGNCTDFHSVFLGMARSQGIPARFHIGFPVPTDRNEGEIGGYHCWAEAWDPERGWVPFDASEAWKAKRFDEYFGTLPSDRIVFTTGRDLTLAPAQRGEALNYFIYPYAERGGVAVEGVKGRYHFQRIEGEVAQR